MRSLKSALFDDPRALALALVLIFVGGFADLATIPQEEDPKIVNRGAVVLTPFPGASAERVERLVTQRIEDALRELPEIKTVRSTSRTGLSSVSIVLQDEIIDNETVFSKARDQVSDVAPSLPAGALEPRFIDDRGYAFTVLVALVWTAEGPPKPLILKRIAEELQSRLRDVPGTEYTDISGVGDEEIAVTLRGDLAQSLGLSEAQIAALIARADAKGSAGQLFAPDAEVPIEVRGELDSLDRIRAVPLRAGAAGGQVRVGDVAEVRRQLVRPEAQSAFVDGRRAVVVGTRMETGLRVGGWAARVRRELDAFDEDLTEGVALERIFDQSEYAEKRFGDLGVNLLIGVGLVVTILFFTLGFRQALLVTLAIPLTALTTLAVMNAVGVKLHQMSVTGMIVALGLLVDAAIVMCDAIGRRLREGLAPRAAVVASVERLWTPLLSSTATTVLAFLPITLLPGGAGEFVGPIADSVIIALISSLVLALTVVPALAGRFLKERPRADGRPAKGGITAPGLDAAFRGLLTVSLAAPRLSILAATVLPILGFIGVTTLPTQFFPSADRNQFHVQLRLGSEASLAATQKAVRTAEAVLRADDRVAETAWFAGNSAPSFYYNLQMNQDGARRFAEAMVTATSLSGLGRLQNDMQDRLERALPGVQILTRTIVQGPPTQAPVELRITGRDLKVLQELGEEARLIFSEIPEVVATTASVAGGGPKIWVEADEDEARRAGLTLGELSNALQAKLQGARGGSVVEGEAEVPVVVRLNDAARASVDEVGSVAVANPNARGARIEATPLRSLGKLALEPSPATITRYQGERVNAILGYVEAGALPSTAVEAFKREVDKGRFQMPYGYTYEFGGDDEARSDAVGALLSSVGVIVTLTVAILVLTFGSFRLGAVVLVVAAMSMGLGMLVLTVFRFPFGFQPVIALIGLVGVAINAAIIIMSNLKTIPAAVAGDAAAVKAGTLESSRHIISTTLTTFAGFLPLILSEGDFWPAFASAIAGGVVLSTVVSFFFVPQAFLLLTRANPVARFDEVAAEAPPARAPALASRL
ncbi:MAG: efflux RND transporter permease subunit [Pseudomonadota bacterium]